MKASLKQSRRTIAPRRVRFASTPASVSSHPSLSSLSSPCFSPPEEGEPLRQAMAGTGSTMEAMLADVFAFSALVDDAVASLIARLKSAFSLQLSSTRSGREA